MICPSCSTGATADPGFAAWRCKNDKCNFWFESTWGSREKLVEIRTSHTAFLSSRRLESLFGEGRTRELGERWFKATL